MTSPTETSSMPVAGDKAPKFKLAAHPEGEVSLDDFHGKKNVILAFYPKDNTPGCTKEMCAFSEDHTKFESADTVVLGISSDTLASHDKFAKQFGLKQKLLADAKGEVGKLYGTIAEGKTNSSRVLFLIDKNGVIQEVIQGQPDNQKLLEIISKL
ncbi:MAG TPA: peroxiredoxin [Drouetiella sp.]